MKLGHKKKLFYGFVVVVVCVGVTYWLAQAWIVSQQHLLTQTVFEKITEQESKISSLSVQVGVTVADDVAASLFPDCSNRQRFDTLLGKLSGTISSAELTELSLIYDQCASFYPHQRSVMALALRREVQVLGEYVAINNTLTNSIDEQQANRVSVWESIADSEIEIARLFTTQVDVQRSIIELLKAGKKIGSPEITVALNDAQEIADKITFQQGLIEKYRQQLN